jgi:hypothetical protein
MLDDYDDEPIGRPFKGDWGFEKDSNDKTEEERKEFMKKIFKPNN